MGVLVTVAALSGCGSSSAKAPTSFPYSSVDGRFSVVFPAKPDAGVREATDNGAKRRVSSALAKKGSDDFGVTWSDFPADFLAAGTAAVLERVRDKVVGDVKATLVSSEETTLGGHPGLIVKAKVASGATKGDYRARFYLVKNRIYEVLVIRNAVASDEGVVLDFFDSFQFTGS